MLSQTAEHALRACLFLARRTDVERWSAQAVAEAVGAPPNYLSKTLNQLARAGLLSSVRGPCGGFRLEADPAQLTVAEIVDLFAPPATHAMCLLGGVPCSDQTPCDAHTAWTAVKAESRQAIARTTLADLRGGRTPARTDATPGGVQTV